MKRGRGGGKKILGEFSPQKKKKGTRAEVVLAGPDRSFNILCKHWGVVSNPARLLEQKNTVNGNARRAQKDQKLRKVGVWEK